MRVVIRVPLVAAVAAVLVLTQVSAVQAAPPPPLAIGSERAVSNARPGNTQSGAAAAFHNGVFFVVWEETPPSGTGTQVYGARVKPDGTVLDPNGILLSTSAFDNNIRPRVAGGGGKFLVVWERAIEGTYSDLDAALVTTGGQVQKQWGLSFGDNGQSSPDVAWNGQLFLAVWQDEPDPGDEDIYGARVLSNGLTLDGCSSDSCPAVDDVGLRIAFGSGNQLRPIVTSTSSSMFLVAWTDQADPEHPTVRDTAVALNGWSLEPAGVALTQSPGAQTQPAAASNGKTSLFAWTDLAGATSNILATTMQPGDESNWAPNPLQPNGIKVSTANGNQSDPAVARRLGHFVVAWTDERSGNQDVFAARVGILGKVLDPTGVGIATGARQQHAPALATSGAKVLVAYQHDVPGAPFGGRDRVFIRIIS